MVMLRASEAQLYQWAMGAADNSDQFKLSVMQWAAIIVPEISDDFVQFLEFLF